MHTYLSCSKSTHTRVRHHTIPVHTYFALCTRVHHTHRLIYSTSHNPHAILTCMLLINVSQPNEHTHSLNTFNQTCTYTHTYTHTLTTYCTHAQQIHTHAHTHSLHTDTHALTHTHSHTRTHTHALTHTHSHTRTHTHALTHALTHTHSHTHAHTHAHAHTHTHKYTHTLTCSGRAILTNRGSRSLPALITSR